MSRSVEGLVATGTFDLVVPPVPNCPSSLSWKERTSEQERKRERCGWEEEGLAGRLVWQRLAGAAGRRQRTAGDWRHGLGRNQAG